MNREKYENIIALLDDYRDHSARRVYYKDYLLERSSAPDLYYINHYILEHHDFVKTLIMIDVLASDSFTKLCFDKQEVPFVHSEIFRDGF